MLTRIGIELWDWFRVITPPLEFVFTIGAVPLRFCRDDPDNPDAQHLRVTEAEAGQLSFAFGDNAADLVWRIVVEANSGGEAERVVLIGSTTGKVIRCKFVIPPIDDAIAFISDTSRLRTGRGVQLPSPVVKLRGNKARDVDDDKNV